MKKIPTIFKRNPENMRELLREPHPDCGWVFNGEGVARRKYDGACCDLSGDMLRKRREVKRDKPVPDDFCASENIDSVTGKLVGWVSVDFDSPADKYFVEGYNNYKKKFGKDLIEGISGTHELCGPKVQGNPENFDEHTLVMHASAQRFDDVPRDFDGLREWLKDKDIEGLVFHHPDGRMAKIKKKDFGLKRKVD